MKNFNEEVLKAILRADIESVLSVFKEAGAFTEPHGAFLTSKKLVSFNDTDNVWRIRLDGTCYTMNNGKYNQLVTVREDQIGTIKASDLAEQYPGINTHRLLVDEPEREMTAREKLCMLEESTIVPLEWYLPASRTERYFAQVLNSKYSPFGEIFHAKDGARISHDNVCYRPLEKLYLTVETGATIVPEIERWLDMGGESYFDGTFD